MKQYIGTKLIEAEKAYRVDGKVVTLAENKVPCGYKVERGYKVRYADGYESFSPQGVFESACLPLEVNGMLKTAAPSISAEMVERFIDHHETVTMGGKSDEEIESEREDLIAIAKAVYAGRGEVEVIDSFFKGGLDVPAGAKAPLYYLSKSLELLATADVAIFAEDWREARGCRIEHECADGYGVARIEPPEEG
nr:MAG TPA: protein of unknown function (DUF4406) [Caudoviricetes sp.]